MIESYLTHQPMLANSAWVHAQASVIGRIKLGEDASIWPQAVLRGDVNDISIGRGSNVQDGSIIHTSRPGEFNQLGYPTHIGEDVTIGHRAMLHGCQIGNRVLVGMAAIVLDGVAVEDEVLIGAGSLVPMNKTLESGYLYLGSPAKKIRALTADERAFFAQSAAHYIALKNEYIRGN